MTHVLATGLDLLEHSNESGLPAVRGWNIINGHMTEASNGERFESRNPARLHDLLGTFPRSGKSDVNAALDAAHAALPTWSATPAPTRGQIIGNMARMLIDLKDDLVRLETREIGKTVKESGGEVQEAIDTCLFFQAEGRRLYGQTVHSELPNKELSTYRRPLGVCAIINACNFPAAVPFWKIIPALICGNTVVWKSPQDAPLLSFALARIMHQAGLPDGVVNLVHGTGSGAGQHLIDAVDEGRVNKVSFTGSTGVGKMIGEVCGRNLVHCSLELGGKNPLVVMPSADLTNAVEGAYWAAFGTAGQRCTSLGNLIVHQDVYDEFVERFMAKVRSTRIGDSLRHQGVLYGPMLSENTGQISSGALRCAKQTARQNSGAKGESRWTAHRKASSARPMKASSCGPTSMRTSRKACSASWRRSLSCRTIVKADDFDHALHLANASPYGLSSACYTNDRLEAYRFKTGIKAGMTGINNSTTGAEAHLPFGGVKQSGNGTRESGMWVIEAYSYWHAVNDELSGQLQLAQMDVEEVHVAEAEVDWSSLA